MDFENEMVQKFERQAEAVKRPSQPKSVASRLSQDQQRNLITEGAVPVMLAAAVPFSQSVGALGFHDWMAEFLQNSGDPGDPVVRLLLQ